MSKKPDEHLEKDGDYIDVYPPAGYPPKLLGASRRASDGRIRVYATTAVDDPVIPPVDPPPVDPPPPTGIASMYAAIYGSGVSCQSKDNYQIGWTNKAKGSYRFIASSDAGIAFIALNQRGGPGYSGGNGGSLRVSVQKDKNGVPDGTDIGGISVTIVTPFSTSQHVEKKNRFALPSIVPSKKGDRYHVVVVNPLSSQTTNYISLNQMTAPNEGGPRRQSAYTDDFAFLYNDHGTWNVKPLLIPTIDITYADGTHDGCGYYQATYTTPPSPITQSIISGNDQVRQTMKPPVDKPLGSVAWRVKRLSGSSPLTLTIEGGGLKVAVVLTKSPSIPPSGMPHQDPGANQWTGLGGDRWVTEDIQRIVLKAGVTYSVRLNCPADSKYCAVPIRGVGDEASPAWGSRVFGDGSAEKSTNGGSTWSTVYPDGRHDWQMYFGLVA